MKTLANSTFVYAHLAIVDHRWYIFPGLSLRSINIRSIIKAEKVQVTKDVVLVLVEYISIVRNGYCYVFLDSGK